MKNTKIKIEKNKEKKDKKHFDIGKSAVRIIALLLTIMMVVAACGTVLYYIVLSAKGLI